MINICTSLIKFWREGYRCLKSKSVKTRPWKVLFAASTDNEIGNPVLVLPWQFLPGFLFYMMYINDFLYRGER